MSGSQVVTDGLWRCLCPSFDSIMRSQLKRPLTRSSATFSPTLRACSISKPWSTRSKYVHTEIAPEKQHNVDKLESHNVSNPLQDQIKGSESPTLVRRLVSEKKPPKPKVDRNTDTRNPTYAFAQNLDNAPLPLLYSVLAKNKRQQGKYIRIVNMVQHLVEKRGEMPNLAHYDALIRANADAQRGSAAAAKTLFWEMKDHGLVPDQEIYNGLLQVLAVHPDHLLRSEILQEMQGQWIELSDEGSLYVFIGLLRDRQYEQAMDKLEDMQRKGQTISPWMYDIFTCVLCEAEEFDQAIAILKDRESRGDLDISNNIWYLVLDACSSNYHYESTLYGWRKKVETDHINPSDGMCLNVLNTASRHGDAGLATDVIRVLATRGVRLDHSHYEALVAAYVGANDIVTAFRLLCIMKKGGLEPDERTTRSLHAHFFNYKDQPESGLRIIRQLKDEGHSIPLAAVNVIIEVFISRNRLQQAINCYKSIHEICESKADIRTFNMLLQGCAKKPGSKGIAMFLAEEMKALRVKPDKFTYDWLITVCLDESLRDYDDAFKYLEEMGRVFENEKLRIQTWHAFLKRCTKERDARYFDILKQMEALGYNTEDLRTNRELAWVGEEIPKRLIKHS